MSQRFNWVEARIRCNAYNLFAELREIVHSDCDEAIRGSDKKPVLHGITFENVDPNLFSVKRKGDSRIFRISEETVTVSDRKGKVLVIAYPRHVGKVCYLEIGGRRRLLPWEFSRFILEEFFFSLPKEQG